MPPRTRLQVVIEEGELREIRRAARRRRIDGVRMGALRAAGRASKGPRARSMRSRSWTSPVFVRIAATSFAVSAAGVLGASCAEKTSLGPSSIFTFSNGNMCGICTLTTVPVGSGSKNIHIAASVFGGSECTSEWWACRG
jgi:hypothetical protein